MSDVLLLSLSAVPKSITDTAVTYTLHLWSILDLVPKNRINLIYSDFCDDTFVASRQPPARISVKGTIVGRIEIIIHTRGQKSRSIHNLVLNHGYGFIPWTSSMRHTDTHNPIPPPTISLRSSRTNSQQLLYYMRHFAVRLVFTSCPLFGRIWRTFLFSFFHNILIKICSRINLKWLLNTVYLIRYVVNVWKLEKHDWFSSQNSVCVGYYWFEVILICLPNNSFGQICF